MSDAVGMVQTLKELEGEALTAIESASDAEALEQARVRFLGRKEGRISAVARGMGALSPEDRPLVGAEANRVKQTVQDALERQGAQLLTSGPGEAVDIDPTMPGRRMLRGAKHPVQQTVDDIVEIFRGLGFTRARGPEVEDEWYNFVALNTPLDHPAADEQDTLYLEGGYLLRSHTSPVQIRTMQQHEPPIRILAPGMVYRRDSYDATHTPAFAQLEGLVVDEGITFVDFKATLAEFARRFWGPDTKVRFRPSFFPFTEPSAEVDVKRVLTLPDGTRAESEWIEIMGAGMVDPAVLEHVGYDPERYTGWAFGMGPGRIAMLRYGVSDLRLFIDGDVRVLSQLAGGAS